MGHTVHQNKQVALSLAQPADAVGSPRWDYAVKRALANQVEGQRQIGQFVACATSIVHPNVVPVMDASTTGTTPYLVMPRIEGRTMGEYLANVSTPLPVALWLVRQLAQALDATHTAGWVHGDLKPDNAIVGVRGHVTLIDFGFASRVHSVPNHVYRGTPDYSSPETLTGQTAMMPAMDIFSLGRLLWQWLAQCERASETLMEPVAEMIEKMVSQDPMERPEASDVAKQLLRLEIETLGCHLVPNVTQRAA
jgi:serine/threonine protein kinase